MKWFVPLMLLTVLLTTPPLTPSQTSPETVVGCELSSWMAYAYQDYNQMYFSNQLPKTVFICVEPGLLTRKGAYAETYRVGSGTDAVYFVHVAGEITPVVDYARIILLHEMVHIKTWDSQRDVHCVPAVEWCTRDWHGPEFQSEMRRLALSGAFDYLW